MFFKNSKRVHQLLQVVLLLVVSYFFYQQLTKLTINSLQHLRIFYPWYLLPAVLLVFLNWYFEWLKWNQILSKLDPTCRIQIRVKAFLSGILSGFLTPNLLGNFIGRMYYFPSGKRKQIILLTLLSNSAQFFASIVFGLFSLSFLPFPFPELSEYETLFKTSLIFLFMCLLAYYFIFESYSFLFVAKRRWFYSLKRILQDVGPIRSYFLVMSLLRHFVFSLQYVLVLKSFGLEFSFVLFVLVWNVFFWSTLIPSLWFGKLLIRESIAIWVFTLYGCPGEVVLVSSVLIWLLNQGLTAFIAIPFFRIKVQDVQ